MAKALLMSGGVGGVTSDDVTARREHVMQGYTALTSDSNDEPVQGTMVNRGNGMVAVDFTNAYWESKFVARMEEGYYSQAGQWKPYVSIPYAVLANIAGVDANRMLSNLTVAGVTGKIKLINTQDNNYRVNKSNAFGIDDWTDRNNPVFWIDFPHGNGYYNRSDGHPHVCIDANNLGTAQADSVLEGQTATSQHGVKFNGAIRRWVSNTGHVITAVNGEGFAWDDTLAGRGRGIVSKIPNGWYIQGAEYVFLSSPNLYPQNIRAGVNINGITGTMPDYSTGRTVFNGATFDETLLSGVANKDFSIGRDYYPLKIDDRYGYTGIYGGGINLTLSTSMPSIRGREIGCVMSQSINLAPFNRIAIYWKFNGTINNGAYFNFKAFVALASNVQRGIFHYGSSPIDGFSTYRKEIFMTDQTQVSYIDVGDINEHAFLGFHANANIVNRDRDLLNGSLQITRIDFLN